MDVDTALGSLHHKTLARQMFELAEIIGSENQYETA
jgi:hypothetical protein